MGSVVTWLLEHHVHKPGSRLAVVFAVIAICEIGALVGLAYVAGWSAVAGVLEHFSWRWLAACGGALLLSFSGYYLTYRALFSAEGRPPLHARQLATIVVTSFAGFHGGAALDCYALRAAGFADNEAKARARALGGLEQGVLAIGASVAAIVVLVAGLHRPNAAFTLPWAICPLPGLVLACMLAGHLNGRLSAPSGWRSRLAVLFESIVIIRQWILRPVRHARQLLGMAIFWAAEICVLWACLRGFHVVVPVSVLIVGFATGMLFSRRAGPLGGAGILLIIMPISLAACGMPLADALGGVLAYRLLTFWPSVPVALAVRGPLRSLGPREPSRVPDAPPSAAVKRWRRASVRSL
ncbi:MAG: hypothetical protein ACRD0Z_14330 [Acidimicrobiales bacterium]